MIVVLYILIFKVYIFNFTGSVNRTGWFRGVHFSAGPGYWHLQNTIVLLQLNYTSTVEVSHFVHTEQLHSQHHCWVKKKKTNMLLITKSKLCGKSVSLIVRWVVGSILHGGGPIFLVPASAPRLV